MKLVVGFVPLSRQLPLLQPVMCLSVLLFGAQCLY